MRVWPSSIRWTTAFAGAGVVVSGNDVNGRQIGFPSRDHYGRKTVRGSDQVLRDGHSVQDEAARRPGPR